MAARARNLIFPAASLARQSRELMQCSYCLRLFSEESKDGTSKHNVMGWRFCSDAHRRLYIRSRLRGQAND